MKKIIKAFRILSLLVTFFVIKIQTTHAQQLDTKTQVIPAQSRTNPEFIKRMADADQNPELAKRMPDADSRLKSAMATADDFCSGINVSFTKISDASGCYLDVTYSHTYTYSSGANPCYLPHGFLIEVCAQAQIQSATVISGAWLSGLTPVISANSVYWVKSCAANFSNIVPTGQSMTVRIKFANGFCMGSTCDVQFKELTGWAYPNNLQFWSCQKSDTIRTKAFQLDIGPDTTVCTGSSFGIQMPVFPPGVSIKWYKYQPVICTDPCPAPPVCQAATAPWVLAQTGGSTCNTNILTATTCYVAVLEYGCYVFQTNIKRVNVCPGAPANTISAPNTPTTLVNGIPHTCNQWSGQLCLSNSTAACCTPKILRWEIRTRGLTYSCTPVWGAWTSWATVSNSAGQSCINTGNINYGIFCQKEYEYRAVLTNACGQSTPTFSIGIDRQLPLIVGTITEIPLLSPLCYKHGTKLTLSPVCAEVLGWEKRVELSPACSNNFGSWIAEGGSQGTCVWWTNNLLVTTQYRVILKNGVCSPQSYSQTYTVKVRPPLTATITATQTVLCPPGVTLTAATSYGSPCNYPVTYQWYKDGLPIPGANQPIYHPITGGNYYVVVSSVCGKAKSNVITICDRPILTIEAPCCMCKGETVEMNAVILWPSQNCAQNCTYHWSTGATTAGIHVSAPGTYTVTVSCGVCPPLTKTITISMCP